jgi:hypothetical protein
MRCQHLFFAYMSILCKYYNLNIQVDMEIGMVFFNNADNIKCVVLLAEDAI